MLPTVLRWRGLPAVALAYLPEEVDVAHHVEANAAYIAGTAIGGAVGRLLPSPLALIGGWALATAVTDLLTLAAAAAALWMLLPPSTSFRSPPATVLRRAVGALGAPRDPVVTLLCVVGFATMGVFVGVYNATGFQLHSSPAALGGAGVFVYLAYLIGVPAAIVMGVMARRIGQSLAAKAAREFAGKPVRSTSQASRHSATASSIAMPRRSNWSTQRLVRFEWPSSAGRRFVAHHARRGSWIRTRACG